MRLNKILFITTSNSKMGSSAGKTGVWLESLATPYYIFKEGNLDISIASPLGGKVPIDIKSQSIIVATRRTKRFLQDKEAMAFINDSMLLEKIEPDMFDAAFLPGGHGCLWDLANNAQLMAVLQAFILKGKPIAFLSQAGVSVLGLRNPDGELWVKGKKLTAFSSNEEKSTGLASIVPLLLENALISAGAIYSKGDDFSSYVMADGNIITGQNPSSAEAVAKKILTLMNNSEYLSDVRRQQKINISSSL